MILETALLLSINYDKQILKPDLNKLNKFEIVQEEKMSQETEALFRGLFDVLDKKSLKEMQERETN